ncbi:MULTISPECIES: hydroxyphenylacetyl-CoA thioesterase PaaI [Halorussus]|uniref:hydroxyphenylacetyl-CoA thioesterase PaaI n=1 Tax=Halorussus TaxID=1070314 RepID=UPI0020A06DD2|nr:hydroxyphenylacetyl-CoA thioesterase PaaI [Halorussus vallis]USZ76408.1 hydroxyphenylacetyl-CoA thioesterase PaaI [Halorussus vallis]
MADVSDDQRKKIAADPFCETLGIELADLGPGTATTELVVTEDLLNFHGTPHGGAVYSLADAAFAAASNAEGDAALAMETNVSYFEAVEVGDTLTAEAERIHERGRTASYRVDVTAEGGDSVAAFRGRVYLP